MAKRSRPPIPQRERIFIGCEGSSERAYAAWLQTISEQLHLHLHVDSCIASTGGGDPLDIVTGCIRQMLQRERQRGKYSVRAILLDSDRLGGSPDRDRQATALAARHTLSLIFQEYDHESFLLRHFPGHQRDRPPQRHGENALRVVWPEYRKPMTRQDLSLRLGFPDLQRACAVELEFQRFLRQLGFLL